MRGGLVWTAEGCPACVPLVPSRSREAPAPPAPSRPPPSRPPHRNLSSLRARARPGPAHWLFSLELFLQLNDYEIRKGKKIGVTFVRGRAGGPRRTHRLKRTPRNLRALAAHTTRIRRVPPAPPPGRRSLSLVDLQYRVLTDWPPPRECSLAMTGESCCCSLDLDFFTGLVEVIIYSSPDDKKKNRGFCFLEYESHKAASLAKRRLGTGRIKVWGCDIIVDWADPQEEPDEQTMSKVKVLYVRNLTQEITEEALKEEFEHYGTVERVKKIKDYAFVHFEDRDCAVKAMHELDGKEMGGARLEVSLAKPPSDKKKKEEILRARERRMTQMIYGRGG
ncbi:Heterogeneous nuclear ribonucleoprotein Q [Papilio xuthus]|uniref:Heterogeneous nuclear ribonucleoprotein Q n=1 Tax=Papilio xuthus TaxID=66420 RepID=A0A194QG02_PAPXU|nr:Heterogeneous nuclear ribonucleoprotein Q [Papilio xuthus]